MTIKHLTACNGLKMRNMRTIKFRGLRADNKEWVYGFYFVTPLTDENSGTAPDKGWYFLTGEKRHCISNDNGATFVIIPSTIGQFTGLHDKNGKEIYEGDVVKILYTDWVSKSENDTRTIDEYKNDLALKGEVMFKDCKFGLRICSDILDSIFCGKHGFIEIIGNIHQTPTP